MGQNAPNYNTVIINMFTCLRCVMPWQWVRWSNIASILFGSQRLWSWLLVDIASRHWRKWWESRRWRNGAWRILSGPRRWLGRSSLILWRWVCGWLITRVAGWWLAIATAVWIRFCPTTTYNRHIVVGIFSFRPKNSDKLVQISNTSAPHSVTIC